MIVVVVTVSVAASAAAAALRRIGGHHLDLGGQSRLSLEDDLEQTVLSVERRLDVRSKIYLHDPRRWWSVAPH
jgi:hypothetical protein